MMTASEVQKPELPYPKDHLEPYISANTLGYHHGKHHVGYFNKLTKQMEGHEEFDGKTLEEVL